MQGANMRSKVFSLIVLATVTVLHPAPAGDTNNAVLPKFTATDAVKHYGENAIVAGKIVDVAIRPAVVILNFEKPSTNAPFTAVIFPRSTNLFGNLSALKGKTVEVKGTIKNYHNKPEIILTNASQLTITALRPGTDPAPAPVPKQP
jgi:hypothetical protein